jgi:hypothetical protein
MSPAKRTREDARPETVSDGRGPLTGLRVLELGTLIAGPFTGRLLGDFGAKVIKVEAPLRGDPMREWGAESYRGKSLTRNTGYANAVAAVECGVEILDASVGGTGGCPFAPRATGNIATEDLVYLLEGMGHETGIDIDALIACSLWLGEQLGRELPGQLRKAGDFALA